MSFIMLAAAMLAQPSAQPSTAVGRWQTPTRHGVVEIATCGSSICGKLIDSDGLRANPQLRDLHNKDTTAQTRMLKGLQILQGFRATGDGWDGGTIYNADDGGTYKATITMVDADTLKLKGCIVWPLCKTQTWTRVR